MHLTVESSKAACGSRTVFAPENPGEVEKRVFVRERVIDSEVNDGSHGRKPTGAKAHIGGLGKTLAP